MWPNLIVLLPGRPESLRNAVDKLAEPLGEEEHKSSKSHNGKSNNVFDYRSLIAHIEKLTEAYERLSKAKEKKAYNQDPALGISPSVYPKSDSYTYVLTYVGTAGSKAPADSHDSPSRLPVI